MTTDAAEETTAAAGTALVPTPAAPPVGLPPARLTSPVLIGRSAELDQLRHIATQLPALVTIEGEAGVGKSRLVREWLADPQLAGRPVLFGHCTLLSEPFPFGPVIDALAGAVRWLPGAAALSPVTGALRPLLPELSPHLPPPLESLSSECQERHRMFRAVRDLLAGIGPAVLVLEDLHEADSGTRELLRFLMDRLPGHLTVVLTYRREDLPDPHAPIVVCPGDVSQLRLLLDPLDPGEVAALAAALDAKVSDAGAAEVYERTAGIPLAVEEMLGCLRHRIADPAQPAPLDRWPNDDDRVPSALRDAFLHRMSRLNPPARRLLQAAAILQTPATEDLLATVGGVSGAAATTGLAELVARALLSPQPDARYRFRHALARQAVHDALAEPTRRQLHRRAVAALQADTAPPLAQLARHCRAAGQVADWLRYAEAAADQAIAGGDDRTASELLQEVVTRPDADRATLVRLAVKLGRAALTGLSHSEAVTIMKRTLAEPDLPAEVRGELRLCLGVLLRNQVGGARQGRRELERAIRDLASAPTPAARAMASLGAPYLLDGADTEQHLEWLARAVRTAEQAADPEVMELVRADRAGALVAIGDPRGWPAAGALPDPDNPPARSADRRRCGRLATNLAWAATCTGHYRRAGDLLRAGERLHDPTAGSYLAGCLAGTGLLYDHAVGGWEGLATRAHDVILAMPDVASVVAEARLVLGLLALSGGELRDARHHLVHADASVPVAVSAAAGLARLAATAGAAVDATGWVRWGLDLIREKGVWCWAAELVPTAVSVLGRDPVQQPVARKLWDEFADGVSGRDSPLADAAVVAGRAALAEIDGEHLAAATQYADAADAYHALPRPYQSAQAVEARGRCLLAAGADGTQAVLDAMAIFERLGASWDLARCRHLLRSLGRELPHRRGRRGYGSQLSPRERDVVRLIRTGLTNREIAETLFLSPRTVEAHVARALRKLGLPSRRTLAQQAGDPPPGPPLPGRPAPGDGADGQLPARNAAPVRRSARSGGPAARTPPARA